MTPVLPPLAGNRPAMRRSLADRILDNEVISDSKATLHTTFSTDAEFLIIKVPRATAWGNLRIKDELDPETNKQKQSATLVISATAAEGSDLDFTFPHVTKGVKVTMPMKPTINLSLGLVYRQFKTETLAPAGE